MSSAVLACKGLCKSYGCGEFAEPVFTGLDLALHVGEACVLLGPSGSGKTTLLSIFGCLVTPTAGELRLSGGTVDFGKSQRLGELRRKRLGFVFQHAQLLPFLSAEENVALVGLNAGLSNAAARARTVELFLRLGIEAVRGKPPGQLSGGQRQRVAIARALVHNPPVVLADEPTAALDWNHGEAVADLLVEQTRAEGTALVVVTHDTRLLGKFDRIFAMTEGHVSETFLEKLNAS